MTAPFLRVTLLSVRFFHLESPLCGHSLSPGKRCSLAARFCRGSVALWLLAFTGVAVLFGRSLSPGKRCSVAARFHRGRAAVWSFAFTGQALQCGHSLLPGKRCSLAARFCQGSVVLWSLAFIGEVLLCGCSLSPGKCCSVAARFHRGSVALWPLAFTGEALLCGRSLSQGKRCSVAARFRLACTVTVVLYTCTCAFPSLSVSFFACVPPPPPPPSLSEGGWGRLMSSPCLPRLESQGCHLIPFSYLLSRFSASNAVEEPQRQKYENWDSSLGLDCVTRH